MIQHGEQLVDADYSSPEGMNKMAEKVAMFKLATGALIKVCMLRNFNLSTVSILVVFRMWQN